MKKEVEKRDKISYQVIFWLFVIGSIVGVVLEGIWCLLKYGHWETHVVTIWEPLCIIYGFGLVGCYIGVKCFKKYPTIIQFLLFAMIGTVVEYICGWVLEYGLHMKAWDYSRRMFNLNGYVTLHMSIIWGLLGIVFRYVVPYIDKLFSKMNTRIWNIIYIIFSLFMAVDLIFSTCCFIRWRNRHENKEPANSLTRYIDKHYNDEFMENRYIEWYFVDEGKK